MVTALWLTWVEMLIHNQPFKTPPNRTTHAKGTKYRKVILLNAIPFTSYVCESHKHTLESRLWSFSTKHVFPLLCVCVYHFLLNVLRNKCFDVMGTLSETWFQMLLHGLQLLCTAC